MNRCDHCAHQFKCENAVHCNLCLNQVDEDWADIQAFYGALRDAPVSAKTGGNSKGNERERTVIADERMKLRDDARRLVCLAQDIGEDQYQQFARRLHRLADSMRKAVDPAVEGIVIGVHVMKHDDEGRETDVPCGGKVWASNLDGTGKCSRCHLTAVGGWWRDLWPETPEDPLTVRESVAWVALEYQTVIREKDIWNGIQRGHLNRLPERRMGRVAVARGELREYANRVWLEHSTAVA